MVLFTSLTGFLGLSCLIFTYNLCIYLSWQNDNKLNIWPVPVSWKGPRQFYFEEHFIECSCHCAVVDDWLGRKASPQFSIDLVKG